MQATELRIGNYVEWNGPAYSEWGLISSISKEEVSFICGDYGLVKDIKGIPLTENLLLKFGFSAESIHHNFTTKENFEFQISSSQRNISTNERMDFYLDSYFGIRIRFVHELQNLYFALTGEELTIKSK